MQILHNLTNILLAVEAKINSSINQLMVCKNVAAVPQPIQLIIVRKTKIIVIFTNMEVMKLMIK